MAADDRPSIRGRVDQEVKDRWDAMLQGRRISQEEAVAGLADWVTRLPPKLQIVVLGQLPEEDFDGIIRLVFAELLEKRPAGRGGIRDRPPQGRAAGGGRGKT